MRRKAGVYLDDFPTPSQLVQYLGIFNDEKARHHSRWILWIKKLEPKLHSLHIQRGVALRPLHIAPCRFPGYRTLTRAYIPLTSMICWYSKNKRDPWAKNSSRKCGYLPFGGLTIQSDQGSCARLQEGSRISQDTCTGGGAAAHA